MLFYPLTRKDKKETKAWDTFSLVMLRDYRRTGEMFLKFISELLKEGDQLNSLVIKDLDFFKLFFNYYSFPELLDSLLGK